jgi:predicted acyl esterase
LSIAMTGARMRKHGLCDATFGLTVTVIALGALFHGTALARSPEQAQYGIVEQQNVPVTMSEGTVLRVNVYYPSTGGQAAPGPFPVLLTQTPYGKDSVGAAAGGATGEDTAGRRPTWKC